MNIQQQVSNGYVVNAKVRYHIIYEVGAKEGVICELDLIKKRARVNWGGNKTWLKFSSLVLI